MKNYRLTFKLKNHPQARKFQTEVIAKETEDIQGIKEERAMYFEALYKTPVKCIKVEEISTK